ncbi:hypothetical protein NEDG_02126 [Nematocida displodere]|uniref:Uncharacterized protein n=1 Tax=Nematocida displodere TaxID=1805483 RepID=A0A177EMP8_9MICR|nr:hypothetical protein NEDG_01436 [Nematocida displodere]OAG32259.1 hypothetical protein NEDG_02126 [Nematocida displodere]
MGVAEAFYAQRVSLEDEARERKACYDPAKEYNATITQYGKFSGLEKQSETALRRKATCLGTAKGSVYAGTWGGEVFVYHQDLALKEQFRAHNQKVSAIKEYSEAVVVLHSDGLVTRIAGKSGISQQIPGFRTGIFHPFLSLCVSGTDGGLCFYDLESSKVVFEKPGIMDAPLSLHPYGSCLLLGPRKGALLDIRTAKVEGHLESYQITSSLFHSSGVTLMAGTRNRALATIDMRTLTPIARTRSQTIITHLSEYEKAVIYSSDTSNAQAICPITRTPLFSFSSPITHAVSHNATNTPLFFTAPTLELCGYSATR